MKYDLEGEAQSLKNNRGIDHGISTSGPNLVILAWMAHELLRGQFWTDIRAYGLMDTQTQATTIPEGQNRPRIKIIECGTNRRVVNQVGR